MVQNILGVKCDDLKWENIPGLSVNIMTALNK